MMILSYPENSRGEMTEHDGLGRVSRREWFGRINTLMESDKPVGGSWRTKHVYALKAAALGHIISERTMTAWNAQGTPTAWTDKWFHYDLLGNVTLETDANAQVTARVDMEAFGTVLTGGQTGFRLTTKPYDSAAGLYYFNARWYRSDIGVFLERAPLSVYQEHPHAFVSGNPVGNADAYGQKDRRWPFDGQICNSSDSAVLVWDVENMQLRVLGAGECTDDYQDWDYNTCNGTWHKIGPFNRCCPRNVGEQSPGPADGDCAKMCGNMCGTGVESAECAAQCMYECTL